MIATPRRWTRVLLGVVVAVLVLAAVRRFLRGDAAAPGATPAEPPPPTPRAPRAAPDPVSSEPAGAPADDGDADTGAGVSPVVDETLPVPDTPPTALAGVDADGAWVPSDGGSCPVSHPVKAKDSSRIFHVEGGLSYERTRADRCYRSPEDAEADGYRAAKR